MSNSNSDAYLGISSGWNGDKNKVKTPKIWVWHVRCLFEQFCYQIAIKYTSLIQVQSIGGDR